MSEEPDSPTEPGHGASSKLFQIHEDDLADLERILPELADLAMMTQAPEPDTGTKRMPTLLRVKINKVKDIVSNVRWDYGPPAKMGIVSA